MTIDYEKFKKATGYDIHAFFTDTVSFFQDNYKSIEAYYQGGSLNEDAFFELNRLLGEVNKIEPLFELNYGSLDTIDMWEILDLFSESQTKLDTAAKTGKWLRSSRLNTNDTSVKINRVLTQGETVESIANELGYSDRENEWTSIALDNLTIEEDYTPEGGTLFSASFKNNSTINLPNIIDYYVGKNVLGKDINKKITFVENDLSIVEYEDALNQSFGIKIDTKKRSIPEFPNSGVDESIIGTNVASLSYPAIFRDILFLFKEDGRFTNVTLINIFRKDDAVFIEFSAKSILKDSLTTNISI